MGNPPEYPHDPSQQPYGQPQQPGGYPGTPAGGQYYQYPGVPPQPPTGGYAQPAPAASGFFGALFDFSFREFVTSRIIKILYILWLILIGFWAVAGLISSIALMSESFFLGFLMLLAVLVGSAISVLLTRVVLELLIVVFRISEDLTAIRQRGGM